MEKRKAMEPLTPLKSFEEIGEKCIKLAKERAISLEPWGTQQAPVFTIERMHLPSRYRDCSFENFQGNDKLISRIKAMAEKGESLVLTGNTGCGKTHLAIASLRCGIEAGKIGPGAIFIPVPELLLKIRSCFRDGATESEEELINRYGICPVLILDDLGAEKTSEFSIATLELILDRRVREDRQTILTTNLTLEEIEGKLSARIASRLSIMNPVKINMPDWRKRRG